MERTVSFFGIMANKAKTTAAPRRTPTLRAVDIVERVARAQQSVSLDEITRESRLPKATVHRMLRLLEQAGLLRRELAAKRYCVGPRLSSLALDVLTASPPHARRHAILGRLVEQIGETCNLTVRDGAEVVYVDRVETSSPVRLNMEAGSRVPLHCTASGKLFLSQLSQPDLRDLIGTGPLRRYTARTITDVAALERELKRIREDRIGMDVSEFLEGSVCLAVPVLDPKGRVCAAVAVHGPAPRMSLKTGIAYLPALRKAAKAIEATLSGDATPSTAPVARKVELSKRRAS